MMNFSTNTLKHNSDKLGAAYPSDKSNYEKFVNPHLSQSLEDMSLNEHYVKADGSWLKSSNGKRILDYISQYGALPFGHNPDDIWNALIHSRDSHIPNFVQPSNLVESGLLAKKLLKHAPHCSQVIFTNSGAESIEAAVKMCRISTSRTKVLSFKNGFHGKTLGALAATGELGKYPCGSTYSDFDRVLVNDIDALQRKLGSREYAALVVEPIQGEAGVVEISLEILQQAQDICKRTGTKFIIDEVQTGLGRAGHMFYSVHQGLTPDVITIAKALGGGLVPIGACLFTSAVSTREFSMTHSSTFAGGSLACRVGVAVLEKIESNDGKLLKEVQTNGLLLKTMLQKLQRQFPELLTEVRGQGFLLGIRLQCDEDKFPHNVFKYTQDQGMLANLFCTAMLHEGVRLAPTLNGRDVVRIEPPLNTTFMEVQYFIQCLERVLTKASQDPTLYFSSLLVGKPQNKTKALAKVRASLGAKPVRAQSKKFAFLIHPLTYDAISQMDPRFAQFNQEQQRDLQLRFSRQFEPLVAGEMLIDSPTGETAEGLLVLVPFTADQLKTMDRKTAREKIGPAIKLAMSSSPEIIGLGGYTSIATVGGHIFKDLNSSPLTSGSVFTAISAEIAVGQTMFKLDFNNKPATIAIVGAGGSIGSLLIPLLAKHASKLILIGNPDSAHTSNTKIMKFVDEYCKQMCAREDYKGALNGALLGNKDKRARWVDHLISSGHITITNQISVTKTADVVVAATSSTSGILCKKNIGTPKVLCDLSLPTNINNDLMKDKSIKIIHGGIIKLPGKPYRNFDIGIDVQEAFACLSETILMALSGKQHLVNSRRNLLDDIEQVRHLAQVHGFKVSL